MDDLIPFIVFVAIALINVIKVIIEKKANGPKPLPDRDNETPMDRKRPVQEIFDTLAEAFDMKPRPVPDWPEEYEQPDYMREAEAYDDTDDEHPAFQDRPEMAQKLAVDKPVREFADAPPVIPVQTLPQKSRMRRRATFVKAMPNALSGMQGIRLPTSPMLRSGSLGSIDYSLDSKEKLRQAIIANVVFSSPRAYDMKFENTILK